MEKRMGKYTTQKTEKLQNKHALAMHMLTAKQMRKETLVLGFTLYKQKNFG